jgi:hydroxymethylbilane synthase
VIIRLGTRGSRLARVQGAIVKERLEAAGHEVEVVVIQTSGDRDSRRSFKEIGAPGVFVREIEQALLEKRIDLAVHSYKDLPSRGPEALIIAAVPERADVRDLLVARREASTVSSGGTTGQGILLKRQARVGTASARRRALLADLRPDITVELIRGNVPTRLGKLQQNLFDAVLLARAGIDRLMSGPVEANEAPLPLDEVIQTPLDPEVFVPAPAQGAIAVQVRRSDDPMRSAAERLDDPAVSRGVRAERSLLARIEGGCSLPFGAWCRSSAGGGDRLEMTAVLGTERGLIRVKQTGFDPEALAGEVYRRLTGRRGD